MMKNLLFILSILLFSTTTWAVHWIAPPAIDFTDKELHRKNREISVSFSANYLGNIQKAEVVKSSGLPELDKKVVEAVLKAHIDTENQNIIAIQPFLLKKRGFLQSLKEIFFTDH